MTVNVRVVPGAPLRAIVTEQAAPRAAPHQALISGVGTGTGVDSPASWSWSCRCGLWGGPCATAAAASADCETRHDAARTTPQPEVRR